MLHYHLSQYCMLCEGLLSGINFVIEAVVVYNPSGYAVV